MDKATKYLVEVFNKHSKGRGATSLPQNMWASRKLFDMFKSELTANQRFIPHYGCGDPCCWCQTPAWVEPTLMFKSTKLHRVDEPGWWVTFSDPKESV